MFDRFLYNLGNESARLGLSFLARGGIYIAGGGIIKKLRDRILDGRVVQAYLSQGKASEIVAQLPLFVCETDDLSFLGAKVKAEQTLKHISRRS